MRTASAARFRLVLLLSRRPDELVPRLLGGKPGRRPFDPDGLVADLRGRQAEAFDVALLPARSLAELVVTPRVVGGRCAFRRRLLDRDRGEPLLLDEADAPLAQLVEVAL